MATLTPKEKVTMWHNGTRKLNVGACSVEKIKKYSEFCKELGYDKEYQILQDELSSRSDEIDFKTLTPEERLAFWKKKVGLTGETGDDVYFYPKAKKDYDKIYKAFEKKADEFLDEDEKKWRLPEFKEGFGGDTFSLYCVDDGDDLPTMELEFTGPDWMFLPDDMQIACCEIEWVKA